MTQLFSSLGRLSELTGATEHAGGGLTGTSDGFIFVAEPGTFKLRCTLGMNMV